MVMMPDLTKTVGEVYAKEGEAGLKARVEHFLKEEKPGTEQAVEAWTRRLANNRIALEQFLHAVSDFMEEQPDKEHKDYGCGVRVDASKVTVYALPPGALTAFVLAHADEFPELADEMFEQWLHTDSNTDFDHAMERWWAVARQHFAPELLQPEGRAERLAELSALIKKHGGELKGRPPTYAECQKFLQDHLKEIPLSSKYLLSPGTKVEPVKEGERVPKPKVPAKPRPEVVITPPKKPVAAAKPKPRPERAPLPQMVTSEQPNYDQQVRGAAHSNYYYWQWQQQPTIPYFYNPLFYGWPRPIPRQPVFGRRPIGRR
jgi:hypothetical protein